MKLKEKNIYDVAKPFYIVLKFFGLACFKIDSKVLKTTALHKCLFVVFLIFWMFLKVVRFIHETVSASSAKSDLLDGLWFFQYNLQHYFGIIILIYNFAQRQHVERLLKSLDDFDRLSRILGWPFKPRSTLVFAMIAFLFLSLTILILHCVELLIKIPQLSWAQHAIYIQIMLFFLVVIQQFTLNVNFVGLRLNHLTNSFE